MGGQPVRAQEGTYESDDLLHCAPNADLVVSKHLDQPNLISGLQSYGAAIVEHDLHYLLRSVGSAPSIGKTS
jgi:hypothetical protein